MKLYEVNQRIADLCEQLEIGCNPETGEVMDNTEDVYEELFSLEERRQDILEWLAKLVLNTRSDCAALKDEEKRLKDRRTPLERKEYRLMQILSRECGGKKTDLGVATLSYRKTSHVDVSDAEKAIGSVKNFVALVKNGSFLVRITDMTILIEKEFIYGSSKRPNPTDYYRKQHYQCG